MSQSTTSRRGRVDGVRPISRNACPPVRRASFNVARMSVRRPPGRRRGRRDIRSGTASVSRRISETTETSFVIGQVGEVLAGQPLGAGTQVAIGDLPVRFGPVAVSLASAVWLVLPHHRGMLLGRLGRPRQQIVG